MIHRPSKQESKKPSRVKAMVLPTTVPTTGSIIGTESRKRRRRQHGSHVSDWHVACSTACVFGGVSLVGLWIWLLHRAISYNPNIKKDNKHPLVPPPLVPPDMMDPNYLTLASKSQHASSPLLMLTWQSNQHAYNQDRAIFYPTFPTRQLETDSSLPEDTEASFLVGLFDGHGRDGHLMAEFVTKNFANALATKLNALPCCQSNDWIAKQLNDTFYQMEEQAVALAVVDPSKDFAFTGGCTATVTMRLGQRLFFANAGDSRTMLASNFVPTGFPNDPYADQVALAMSRSLGDHEWTTIGVTPEPIVNVIQLHREDSVVAKPYLIVASDGLWDCRARRPQFFAKQIGAILFQDGLSHKEASEKLVDLVKQVTPQNPDWYRDDITVIAFRL
eukprot:scaffold2716_cov179-Amphora_coffeaeformis.AAC.13